MSKLTYRKKIANVFPKQISRENDRFVFWGAGGFARLRTFHDQLLNYAGIAARELLLFSDLFLQNELHQVQSEHD